MMPTYQIAFDFDNVPTGNKLPEAIPSKDFKKNTAPSIIDVTPLASPTKNKNNKPLTRGRMSLKNKQSGADLIEIPDDELLFAKAYYSIKSVANMFKVNPSLIRFWENEFDILKPKKNGKGDRFFRPEDVKNLKLIYNLLRERKYTIEGAKDFLKHAKNVDEKFALVESLKKIKNFLTELKAHL